MDSILMNILIHYHKQKIINQLRSSPYFQDSLVEDFDLLQTVESGLVKKIFKDHETNDYLRRETYQKLKMGYVSDYDVITISKKENILTFERINE